MPNFFLEYLKRIEKLQKTAQKLHDSALAQYQKELHDFGYYNFRLANPSGFKWYFLLAEFDKIDPAIVKRISDNRKLYQNRYGLLRSRNM